MISFGITPKLEIPQTYENDMHFKIYSRHQDIIPDIGCRLGLHAVRVDRGSLSSIYSFLLV
jgi:hypothetical protein